MRGPYCSDRRFGRRAEFWHHYTTVHVPKKIEQLCPVEGCDRSRSPRKDSNTRSFGARKDTMEEHVQTVHFVGRTSKSGSLQTHDGWDKDNGANNFEDGRRPLTSTEGFQRTSTGSDVAGTKIEKTGTRQPYSNLDLGLWIANKQKESLALAD